MTIVAWDGKTLACDSMMVEGGRKSWCMKFWRTESGVYTGAGKWTDLRAIVRALSTGQPVDEDLYADTLAIHLDTSGKLWLYEDAEPQLVKGREAWGSGRNFALGALSMGAMAAEAAKIACKHSTTCGGKIHVFGGDA